MPLELLAKVLLVFGCPVLCLAKEDRSKMHSQLLAARLVVRSRAGQLWTFRLPTHLAAAHLP